MVGVFAWGDDIEKGEKDLRVRKELCYKKVTAWVDMA